VLRQEPRGFLTLSADTLSLDADLRPINVRRLLTLLRRLALRVGPSYVFEPNDDAFRRMIQRGFEEVLDQLYLRGAFAGATASAAYRVDASALNTPRNVEQGQFIVELRVAPSLPMTFLTVRLVHSGERTAVTEER
jgi:phage tail sheath protein FI